MSFMFKPYPYVDPLALNRPAIPPEVADAVTGGMSSVAERLFAALPPGGVLLLDGYVGAQFAPLLDRLRELAPGDGLRIVDVATAYKDAEALEAMLAPSLPEDRTIDPILLFGKSMHWALEDLLDPAKLEALAARLPQAMQGGGRVVVYGCGAAVAPLRALARVAAFVDVTPLQATNRVQERRVRPLGDNQPRGLAYVFRRLYYFDYEIMMLHRQQLLDGRAVDFYIDGNQEFNPKLMPVDSLWSLLGIQASYPFRCTPVYIEGVWGGQFVKRLRQLPDDMRNCAWVFDMIPNEVSLQVKVGRHTLNLPFSTFFKAKCREVMGDACVERFGRVFPIRFNYDDTYGGTGNMSIQVHPPQAYNQKHFGEPFQQDESYYVVKTAGSKTYLGLRDDCDVPAFFACIDRAEKDGIPFDHDAFVNSFPSEEGDQFLLPGGTIHASGRNQVVLEIGSYTIGSYTFKLYDYLRRDLEGKPRPIHSFHGKNVLVADRRRSTVDGVLRPRPVLLREGEGWREEILGEHELLYFSLRRLVFDHAIDDCTDGRFHVLVLVEGEEVLVYAKDDPARCFRQRFMEMVVVPASLGRYGILNLGSSPCKVTKTHLK